MRMVIEECIAELKETKISLQKEIQAREEIGAARLSQEIFNAASEAIIIFDVNEYKILHANDAMLDLFGFALDQVIGLKVGTILRDNDAEAITRFIASISAGF